LVQCELTPSSASCCGRTVTVLQKRRADTLSHQVSYYNDPSPANESLVSFCSALQMTETWDATDTRA